MYETLFFLLSAQQDVMNSMSDKSAPQRTRRRLKIHSTNHLYIPPAALTRVEAKKPCSDGEDVSNQPSKLDEAARLLKASTDNDEHHSLTSIAEKEVITLADKMQAFSNEDFRKISAKTDVPFLMTSSSFLDRMVRMLYSPSGTIFWRVPNALFQHSSWTQFGVLLFGLACGALLLLSGVPALNNALISHALLTLLLLGLLLLLPSCICGGFALRVAASAWSLGELVERLRIATRTSHDAIEATILQADAIIYELVDIAMVSHGYFLRLQSSESDLQVSSSASKSKLLHNPRIAHWSAAPFVMHKLMRVLESLVHTISVSVSASTLHSASSRQNHYGWTNGNSPAHGHSSTQASPPPSSSAAVSPFASGAGAQSQAYCLGALHLLTVQTETVLAALDQRVAMKTAKHAATLQRICQQSRGHEAERKQRGLSALILACTNALSLYALSSALAEIEEDISFTAHSLLTTVRHEAHEASAQLALFRRAWIAPQEVDVPQTLAAAAGPASPPASPPPTPLPVPANNSLRIPFQVDAHSDLQDHAKRLHALAASLGARLALARIRLSDSVRAVQTGQVARTETAETSIADEGTKTNEDFKQELETAMSAQSNQHQSILQPISEDLDYVKMVTSLLSQQASELQAELVNRMGVSASSSLMGGSSAPSSAVHPFHASANLEEQDARVTPSDQQSSTSLLLEGVGTYDKSAEESEVLDPLFAYEAMRGDGALADRFAAEQARVAADLLTELGSVLHQRRATGVFKDIDVDFAAKSSPSHAEQKRNGAVADRAGCSIDGVGDDILREQQEAKSVEQTEPTSGGMSFPAEIRMSMALAMQSRAAALRRPEQTQAQSSIEDDDEYDDHDQGVVI